MIRLKHALREAGILILVATALGFIYTAATEKGLFAHPAPSKTTPQGDAGTPTMISRDEAWALFQTGSAVFVDARPDFDFKLGHIKGAINVPLKEYDARKSALSGVSIDRVILAYCDGAECNSSIELSVKLMKDGHRNVRIFFGGWSEWAAANLPSEK
jgi:rhodanese-related sulfurtransferase